MITVYLFSFYRSKDYSKWSSEINNCDDNFYFIVYFTGVKIIPDDRVKITHCDDNCCNLQIDKVTPEDEGK